MPIMEQDLVHGCGRTFKYPAHYAKHGLKCDGRPPARSRIDGGPGASSFSTSDEGAKQDDEAELARTARSAHPHPAKRPTRTPPVAKRASVRREKVTHTKPVVRRKAARNAINDRQVALAVLVPEAKTVSPQDFLASLDVQIERLLRVRAVVAEIA